jgi:hypothetical protein
MSAPWLPTQAGSADAAFTQFVALCQGAGPARCALARHPETAAQRVAGLFRRARRAPIPAPHASPPGVLSYIDLLVTTFSALRSPDGWPWYARELDAAAGGDGSALETLARQMLTPDAFAKATTSTAIQCLDAPAGQPVSAWPRVIKNVSRTGKLWGPYQVWSQWAPCAANWPGHATERYTGPWNAKTKTPILLINNVYDPATGYSGAQRVERRLGIRCCSPWPATATRLSCPARVLTNGESVTSSISSPRRRARSAEPSDRSGDIRHRYRDSEPEIRSPARITSSRRIRRSRPRATRPEGATLGTAAGSGTGGDRGRPRRGTHSSPRCGCRECRCGTCSTTSSWSGKARARCLSGSTCSWSTATRSAARSASRPSHSPRPNTRSPVTAAAPATTAERLARERTKRRTPAPGRTRPG